MRRVLGIIALALIVLLLVGDAVAFAGDSGLLEKTLLAAMAVLLVWAAARISRWAL